MPYATQLHLVPPPEARPCRKCGRTDVEFRRAHKRDYMVGNIAVISKRANNIKSNATIEELDRVAAWLRATLGR